MLTALRPAAAFCLTKWSLNLANGKGSLVMAFHICTLYTCTTSPQRPTGLVLMKYLHRWSRNGVCVCARAHVHVRVCGGGYWEVSGWLAVGRGTCYTYAVLDERRVPLWASHMQVKFPQQGGARSWLNIYLAPDTEAAAHL